MGPAPALAAASGGTARLTTCSYSGTAGDQEAAPAGWMSWEVDKRILRGIIYAAGGAVNVSALSLVGEASWCGSCNARGAGRGN